MATAKERQLEAALQEANEIARKTSLTDEERFDLKARVEAIEGMKKAIAEEQELRAAIRDVVSPADLEDSRRETEAKSLGAQFVKSATYDWLRKGGRGESPAFEFKAEPTAITEAASAIVVADRRPGIEPLASFPLGVADLIPTYQTNSNAVSYVVEATETSAIAAVAEGAEKPNFGMTLSVSTEEVEVIAGMAALTRQMLEDAPFVAGFLNSRMTYKLRQVEEDQILEGNGSTPNLKGIDTFTTSTLSQGTETVLDAIYKAADKAFTDGGYPADALVINPTNWQPIRLSTDDTGRYYGDGPFGNVLGDTVWGLRVVKSTQLTAGTVFVGSFRNASFLARNGGLTIRTSDSHSDYFKKNLVAVLIEERVAHGMPAPLAITQLTLT